jgi:hypothetical protein
VMAGLAATQGDDTRRDFNPEARVVLGSTA